MSHIRISAKDLETLSIGTNTVAVYKSNDMKWYKIGDIFRCVGRCPRDAHRFRTKDENKIRIDIDHLRNVNFTNAHGVKEFLLSTRKIRNEELNKYFGIDVVTSSILCIESDIGFAIKQTFKELNVISQYKVEYKYTIFFIDFYFPDQRIAVEIDENAHKTKQYSSDKERQKFIEDKLRCTFIRCNPDEIGFNIFSLLHKIRMEMKNKNMY